MSMLTELKLRSLVEEILHTITSPNTRENYRNKLREFLDSGTPLTESGIQTYLAHLQQRGCMLSTLRLHRVVIFRLAKQAKADGQISIWELRKIHAVPTPKPKPGVLKKISSRANASWALLEAPNRSTFRGQRDAAILAFLLGCGMTPSEASSLTWKKFEDDYQNSGLVPPWALKDILIWKKVSEGRVEGKPGGKTTPSTDSTGTLSKRLNALGGIKRASEDTEYQTPSPKLSSVGISSIVRQLAEAAGVQATPADLRRAWKENQAAVEAQISELKNAAGKDPA